MPSEKGPLDGFFDFVDSAIDVLDKNLPASSKEESIPDYIDVNEVKITWGLPESKDAVIGWHIFDGVSDETLCGKQIKQLRYRYAILPNGYCQCCSACLAKLQDAFEKQ